MASSDKGLIFKIVSVDEWSEAAASGQYGGSADDLRDGYIHFSASHQLEATMRKYFSRGRGLALLAFDPSSLGPELKWEASRGGDLFPHLYAPLPVSAARWIKPIPLNAEGFAELPRGWERC